MSYEQIIILILSGALFLSCLILFFTIKYKAFKEFLHTAVMTVELEHKNLPGEIKFQKVLEKVKQETFIGRLIKSSVLHRLIELAVIAYNTFKNAK